MTSFQRTKSIVAVLITLGFMAFAHEAQAISVGPRRGLSTDPTMQDCFETGDDAAENFCEDEGLVYYTIPLTVNAGSHTVRINGLNQLGNGLFCALCSTDQSANIVSCAGFPIFPVGASVQTATNTVPTNGGLFVSCGIGYVSAVSTINYNQ